MRDALAILDKCIGLVKNITVGVVSETVGIASSDQLFDLSRAILQQQPQKAISVIDDFNTHSKDMLRLTHELIGHFRNLMLIKTLHDAKNLLVVSEEDYTSLCDIAGETSLETIIFIMDTLQRSFEKMNRGCEAKTELEICLVKLCSPELSYSNEALAARLEALEKKVRTLAINPISNSATDEVSSVKKEEPQEKKEEILTQKLHAETTIADLQKNAQKMTNWHEVLEALKNCSHTISTAFNGSSAYVSGDFVLIDSENEMAFELLRKSSQRDKMREAIKNVTGKAYKLGPYNGAKTEENSEDPLKALANKARRIGITVNEK